MNFVLRSQAQTVSIVSFLITWKLSELEVTQLGLNFLWKLQPTTAKQTKIQTNYNGHWSTCSGHYFGITPLNPFFFLQGHVTSYVCTYECTFVARLHTISKYSISIGCLGRGGVGNRLFVPPFVNCIIYWQSPKYNLHILCK